MKEVSIPSEGEQHWDWLPAPGSRDADTALGDEQRAALQTLLIQLKWKSCSSEGNGEAAVIQAG